MFRAGLNKTTGLDLDVAVRALICFPQWFPVSIIYLYQFQVKSSIPSRFDKISVDFSSVLAQFQHTNRMASDAETRAKEAFIDDHFELAVDLYSQAISMDPKNAELYADRAQANIKLRNFTGLPLSLSPSLSNK